MGAIFHCLYLQRSCLKKSRYAVDRASPRQVNIVWVLPEQVFSTLKSLDSLSHVTGLYLSACVCFIESLTPKSEYVRM